jgi:hypothetical protein
VVASESRKWRSMAAETNVADGGTSPTFNAVCNVKVAGPSAVAAPSDPVINSRSKNSTPAARPASTMARKLMRDPPRVWLLVFDDVRAMAPCFFEETV